jgi:hypothetical protein
VHDLKAGLRFLWCLRFFAGFTNAHWKRAPTPLAEKVNVALCFFLLILALVIRVWAGRRRLNVAVTAWELLSPTVQVDVPLHPAPFQPPKADPASGAALSTTVLPFVKAPRQVGPQLMPAGALVTVPDPEPDLVTVSARRPRTLPALTMS